MIPGNINTALISGAEGGGYQVQRSLRFNSSDSAFCSRTPSTAGNRKTWTWAGWVKRSKITSGDYEFIFGYASGSTYEGLLWVVGSDQLEFWSNPTAPIIQTTQLFRDPSAWFHIVLACDTTQATASNRVKLYINGSQVTQFDAASYPAQDFLFTINNTVPYNIGSEKPDYGRYFNGYLADIHFIDGQALDPSSFTEVSATTGQLIPKAYTGSFGTNGFWLKFSDNSAATATTLGKDYSGNSNNWTPNNFVASYTGGTNYTSGTTLANGSLTGWFDGLADNSFTGYIRPQTLASFTNIPAATTSLRIYCWAQNSNQGNFIVNGSSTSISTGTSGSYQWINLNSLCPITLTSFQTSAGNAGDALFVSAIEVDGTILVDSPLPSSVDSLVDTPSSAGTDTGLGGQVAGNYATLNPLARTAATTTLSNGNLEATGDRNSYGTFAIPSSGKWYWEVTPTAGFPMIGVTAYVSTSTAAYNDVGLLYAAFNGDKWINGTNTSYGASYTSNDVIGVAVNVDAGTVTFYKNNTSQGSITYAAAGLFPASTTGGGSATLIFNFGQRPFAYTAPSGFKALCDTNLPAPVVAKSSDYFQTVLYTGNGSTQTISGLGFSPDLVWMKVRSAAEQHEVYDSVRGVNKALYTDYTDAEGTYTDGLTSFNSDGFSLGSRIYVNGSSKTYVGWAWDAGTTTTTNTQGSITSSVRANASAGFSVVTYSGTGTTGTVGHGGLVNLDKGMIIVKTRTGASVANWMVYHGALGATKVLEGLNTTSAASTSSAAWNNTAPTSTVFTVGNESNVNGSGRTFVAYCFAPVAGYSSFGSYTGNGSADGPFVFCNFRPRWILIKNTSASADWCLFDTARDTYNQTLGLLNPNLSSAENILGSGLDILSNGFKLRRDASPAINNSGNTFVWAAFAESPFQYARAR